MTLGMASHSRCLFGAAGDRNTTQVNGLAETDADVASTLEKAFLIGVAGGTASGKVIVLFFSMHSMHISKVTETFAPKNFRSRERKYHGMELSLPGAKVPRTFAPWNFRSRERKVPRTFAPWNFRSLELSLPG